MATITPNRPPQHMDNLDQLGGEYGNYDPFAGEFDDQWGENSENHDPFSAEAYDPWGPNMPDPDPWGPNTPDPDPWK